MKSKAVLLLILLKQNKIVLPGLLLLISSLFTIYLLYPHNVPQTAVAGISISKLPKIKLSPTTIPKSTTANGAVSQVYISIVPSPAVPSKAQNTTAAATTDYTSSKTNSSSNTISTPNSSSNNVPSQQNVSTPTNIPAPTTNPVNNNNFSTITPTMTPSGNGNEAIVGNSVNTIVHVAPTPTIGTSGTGTSIATGTSDVGTSSVGQIQPSQ